MALLLRVVISSTDARRLQLFEVPQSVESLISILKEKLQLQGQFVLQFEDPDFGNALCSLTDISELPSDKAVLHIQWCNSSLSETSLSVSSLDTASVDDSDGSLTSSTASVQRYLRTTSEWPLPFPIPPLSFDVELKLRRGNETYAETQTGIDVTRDIKMEILDKIVQAVFDIKAYPNNQEIESIASALISKYPCLKEPGKGKGYEGWLISLKNKLNNYRSKLRAAGCNEVSVNKKRKDVEHGHGFTMKKAKRGEVNFVPEHPCNHTDASLEEQRRLLIDETKKARSSMVVISEKMELTFSLRRKEVVEDQPMVVDVQQRWPALFLQEQIAEEFFRITNKDLLDVFRAAMDRFTPKLLKLYRARKAAFGEDMEQLLERLDERVTDVVNHRRTTALKGLPLFLREDPNKLFMTCKDTEDGAKGVSIAILCVLEDETQATSPEVVNIAVVLEQVVVLKDLPDISTALAYLFGLLYALNMSYPQALKYTFDTIQNVFMELGSGCTKRVLSLKNKLL
uniref:Uncharacterized protein n=1 Tax=Cyprinus carpio TaxID=7962 RepID=A0A8C1UMQ8_CYPCA